MPISEPYELDGVTVGSTELSIVSGTTTLQTVTDDGIYSLWLDPVGAGMAKGDEFRIRRYEKCISTGTKRVIDQMILSHAQTKVITFPPIMLLHGWDMTIQKISGTDRAWDASIRAVTGSGLTQAYSQSALSVSTTELSITGGTSTLLAKAEAGFYQLVIDAFTMAKADEFEIRILEKVEATGGTQRQILANRITDVQSELWYSPSILLKNGWEMTLKKIAGTDRAIDASIRKAA